MFSNYLLSQKLYPTSKKQNIELSGQNQLNMQIQPVQYFPCDITFQQYLPISDKQIVNQKEHEQFTVFNSLQNLNSQESKNYTFLSNLTSQASNKQQSNFKQNQEKQQQENQLQILKNHLINIQSIAMKQISDLKQKLSSAIQQNKLLTEQLKTINSKISLNSCLTQSTTSQQANNPYQTKSVQSEQTRMLKQQNQLLKQALKKQIQINKNLIKQSMIKSIKQLKQCQINQINQQKLRNSQTQTTSTIINQQQLNQQDKQNSFNVSNLNMAQNQQTKSNYSITSNSQTKCNSKKINISKLFASNMPKIPLSHKITNKI